MANHELAAVVYAKMGTDEGLFRVVTDIMKSNVVKSQEDKKEYHKVITQLRHVTACMVESCPDSFLRELCVIYSDFIDPSKKQRRDENSYCNNEVHSVDISEESSRESPLL